MTPYTPARARRLVPVAAAGLLLASAACGSSTTASSTAPTTPATTTGTSAAAASLTVTDTWAKANTDLAASSMTGVFGKVTNTGSSPVTIVSGTNSVSALTELHETVMKDGAMVMQPVTDGFTIAAGQTRELKPGSDHVMVMKMTTPLKPGDPVQVTLRTKDGGTVKFTAVAKVFTMGNEPYVSATK